MTHAQRKHSRALQSALTLALLVCSTFASAEPSLAGMWMPAPELAATWLDGKPQLTTEAAALARDYDPRRSDSTLFCMPRGTPRNTLSTAPAPLEILQRAEQITLIFDGRGDVRRFFLDGRPHPQEPVPNWLGHSTAKWQGEELLVDTVALSAESRLDDSGLPHSEGLHLSERWRLTTRQGEMLLEVALTLEDAASYTKPLRTTRYFRRAPQATMSEASAYCLLDQWRGYLEKHNKELSVHLRKGTQPERGTRR